MESSRRLIILLVAGVVVAFGAIWISSQMSSEPETTGTPVSDRYVVAKRDIAPGSFVQVPQDIDWESLGTDVPNKDVLIHEGNARIEDFSGAVVRRPLRSGEPIPLTALMRSGEGGFMSAVLEPGMRAVSIAVNATSGNAGFISPGDRVDLIVTHRIKKSESTGGSDSVVSETFVHDVRVVAVDQMLDNPENKAILAKTVTVEVTPNQAEQVAVASEMGKISVTLRSTAGLNKKVGDGNAQPTANIGELYDNNVTRDSDVSRMLESKGGVSPRVRVIRGGETESIDF